VSIGFIRYFIKALLTGVVSPFKSPLSSNWPQEVSVILLSVLFATIAIMSSWKWPTTPTTGACVLKACACNHGELTARSASMVSSLIMARSFITGYSATLARSTCMGYSHIMARSCHLGYSWLLARSSCLGSSTAVARSSSMGYSPPVARSSSLGYFCPLARSPFHCLTQFQEQNHQSSYITRPHSSHRIVSSWR
jgi:hypothetical protein